MSAPTPLLDPGPGAGSLAAELPRRVAARSLARASALIVWSWLAAAPVVLVLGQRQYDRPLFLVVMVGMVIAGAVLSLLVARRPDRLGAVTGAGLLVVAGGIAAFDTLMDSPQLPSNPAVTLLGAAALVVGLALRPGPGLAAVLFLGLWHGGWVAAGAPEADRYSGYVHGVLTVATALAGGRLIAVALGRSSRQVGVLVGRLMAARRAEQVRRVRENSLAAARTDLHDTVLTTLSGIGAGWLSSGDPQALRDELHRDLQVLEELDRPGAGNEEIDLVAALEALAGTARFAGLEVDVRADGPLPVPAVVADAVVPAAREVLVNVVRHAGTPTADVRVERCDGELRVSVTDAGAGFDPEFRPRGLGLAGVAGRLADLGGRAVVGSAPGRGTTVTLAWPEQLAAAGPVPPLWSVEGPRWGAVGLSAVTAITVTLAFLVQLGGYREPWPQYLSLALVVGGEALVIATLTRRPDLPGWLSALLLARFPAVILSSGLPLAGCAAMGYQHFSAGGMLLTCVVITFLRPLREAVLAVAVFSGSYAVLAVPLWLDGRACSVTLLANAATAACVVLATSALVSALHRHARIAAEVLAAEEGIAVARSAHAARAAERRRLLPAVRGIVAETVTGLATGRLDARDPEVRARCRRDARLLRSFLAQAGDGDDLVTDLFGRAMALRPAGVDLAVRGHLPRDSVSPAQRHALLTAVDSWLGTATAHGWAGEGWLTVLRSDADVLVTLVLRDAPPAGTPWLPPAAEDAGLVLDRAGRSDGDLWLTCRLRAAPPTADPLREDRHEHAARP